MKSSILSKWVCILVACITVLFTVSCDNTSAVQGTTVGPIVTTDPETAPPQDDPPVISMLPAQEVKVISMNLWSTDDLGDRADAMITVFEAYGADSIGVQEGSAAWADALDTGLGDRYARVGVDMYGADKGNFATYIYYLKEKYTAVESGTFWLSPTPDEPSSFGVTVEGMNRTCTWVVLENVETGFRYVHINAHLDWRDMNVNVIQVQMIRNQMLRFERMGYPVFATGDFNASQGSISYQQMTTASTQIADSKMIAKNTMSAPTHDNGDIIDYCFVTSEYVEVLKYKVIEDMPNEVKPSDHRGVFTHSLVASLPQQKQADDTPEFSDDFNVRLSPLDAKHSKLLLSFAQAKSENGFLAATYRVTLKKSDGSIFLRLDAGARSFCELPPERASVMLSGGVPNERYSVEIVPISLFGEEGTPACAEIVWSGEAVDLSKIPEPSILDLSVQGDTIVENSQNDYVITKLGGISVADGKISYQKNGNVKIEGINKKFIAMERSFTIETVLTTGEDIQSFQCPLSCLDSGGFGFKITNGALRFNVHNGQGYVEAVAPLQANTTYHIVGIFDGVSVSVYLNGVLIQSVDFSSDAMKSPASENAAYLSIGADSNRAGTGEHYSEGSLSLVRIYSDALHSAQVLQLAQRALAS